MKCRKVKFYWSVRDITLKSPHFFKDPIFQHRPLHWCLLEDVSVKSNKSAKDKKKLLSKRVFFCLQGPKQLAEPFHNIFLTVVVKAGVDLSVGAIQTRDGFHIKSSLVASLLWYIWAILWPLVFWNSNWPVSFIDNLNCFQLSELNYLIIWLKTELSSQMANPEGQRIKLWL